MELIEGADIRVVRCKGAFRARKRTQIVRRIEAVPRKVAYTCGPRCVGPQCAGWICWTKHERLSDGRNSTIRQRSGDGSRSQRWIEVGYVSRVIDVGRYQVVQPDVSNIISAKYHSRTQLTLY